MWRKHLPKGETLKAILITIVLAPMVALGQPTTPAAKNPDAAKASKADPHRDADVARHRQMAKAHEEAARCFEAGTAEKECHERLRAACKGIAVGQYCGMRHAH